MSEWVAVPDPSLDWKDGGRSIELRNKEGNVVSGTLHADMGFNGEDEYPIWFVTLACGGDVSLWDFEEMRFP